MFACFSSVRPPQSDIGNLRAMVDRYTEEFNTITEFANEKRKAQDLEDLNHERVGADVGRISRFLGSDAHNIINGERKDRKGIDPLELALLSAEYMQAFENADLGIRGAQQKGDKVRAKLDEAIEQLQREIDETLEDAVTMPDGRKAFMNEHGEAFTEDGERVDQAIVDGIDWAGRPSLEKREDQLRRMAKLHELSGQEQRLSFRLGELHNELHDDKPSQDRVDEIRKEADAIFDQYGEMNVTIGKLTQSHTEPEITSQTTIITPEKAVIPDLS